MSGPWHDGETGIENGQIYVEGWPLFRCVCGKNHVTGVWWSTKPTHCPCGEPFPRDEFFQWRATA